MLSQQVRHTTFADIPVHRGKGARPSRINMALPHTNEVPVTNPFRQALEKRLDAMGVESTCRMNLARMEDGWALRRKIAGTKITASAVSAVLGIEDQHERVLAMHVMSRDRDSVCMEIHAYRRAAKDDSFQEVYDWSRLGSTMILVMRDIEGYFLESLAAHCQSLARNPCSAEVARMRGIDTEKTVVEIKALLREIGKRRSRIRLIELPGDFSHISSDHHMFGHYFRNGMVAFHPDEYEMKYCAGAFGPAQPSQGDVERVSRLAGL